MQRKAVMGETVVKFYDDVMKEKDRHQDMCVLSNENLRKKFKAVTDMLRMLSHDQEDHTTKQDIEKMKVLNQAANLRMEEGKAEYRALQKLLGEVVFNEKMLRKKLAASEEELGEHQRESLAMRRLTARTGDEIMSMQFRRETCEIEHKRYSTLQHSSCDTPETEDYVKEVDRCQQLRKETQVWERKIRIKQMELENLKKELGSRRRRSLRQSNGGEIS